MSPFGMAIVVPTLELFANEFESSYSTIQFIISAYLFGLAIAQPFMGFLSDKLGRKPVMISGIILFIIASYVCMTAETLSTLIIARFFQGVGASVGTVTSRAIIRDSYPGDEAAKPLSRVTATMGMAPMIAPVVGAIALSILGSPSGIFLITLLIGFLILIPVLLFLPETVIKVDSQKTQASWYKNYYKLMRSETFVGSTFIYGFTTGSFFAILAVGSTVFSKDLGIESTGFGLIWSSLTILYASGSFFAGNLTARIGLMRVLSIGAMLNLAAGFLFALLIYLTGTNIFSIVFPLSLMFFAHGFIVSMSMAKAVSDFPNIAGASSGLSSSLGLVTGGMFSILSGSIYSGEFFPIAIIVWLSTCFCYLCFLLVRSGDKKKAIQIS
ncbi:MAG: hypothetical protein CMQ73_01735 [Gammaproteobacteria bacterium]|nr:hypothetical protein [Gammaproteobacteria bacterium]OUT96286.1 MAG: hypothetical protein CBB96_02030 [Gammaproteobacteria bacterium TMED36]|tara:strand:+ start:3146 stop:4297 length:1152 start_codon:yes stop_codon:yes gene_type:complete